MLPDDPMVRFFHRHLAPILFTISKDDAEHQFVVTAFVLSVEDKWFLVTAGHCLREIEEYKSHRYTVSSCALIDSLGTDPKDDYSIPFAYELASPQYLSQDLEYDYGIIALSTYYREHLQMQGIHPLTERVWDNLPDSFHSYKLLGIPYELLEITPHLIRVITTLHNIDPLQEWPEDIEEPSSPQFLGKIALGDGLNSIRGTSGGPIFGFKKDESGHFRYWLVALQSRWLRRSRIIIGCPMKLLGDFLRYRTINDNGTA
jgi:hypothetical protein